ncbi:MAG: FHA domain-containing protein [Betaproteobacteria bacterium]|nr:FHA domain-containing protein [Betaproteobacteria bacterium]
MAKLILSMDGLVLNEFHLNKPRISIGRRSTNDIQINNLAVSGEHAAIITILNDSFLEDLQSTNGTQVNGRAVKKCVLHHNDEIGFGKYKIKYLVDATPAERQSQEGIIDMKDAIASDIGTASNFGAQSTEQRDSHLPAINTPVDPHLEHQLTSIIPGAVPAADTESLPDAASNGVLRILSGSNRGKELPLNKEHALLGKNGGSVAAISRDSHFYYLSYVEGDSRPLVNRKPLGDAPRRLNNGDEIEIAGVHMMLILKA